MWATSPIQSSVRADAGQQGVDHRAGPPGARRAAPQQVLGGMQHPAHRREIEQPRRALQRVDGAEHAIDDTRIGHAGIGVAALQRQQVVRRVLHQFAALDQELVEQLVHQAAGR